MGFHGRWDERRGRHSAIERNPLPWRGSLTVAVILAVLYSSVRWGGEVLGWFRAGLTAVCPFC